MDSFSPCPVDRKRGREGEKVSGRGAKVTDPLTASRSDVVLWEESGTLKKPNKLLSVWQRSNNVAYFVLADQMWPIVIVKAMALHFWN